MSEPKDQNEAACGGSALTAELGAGPRTQTEQKCRVQGVLPMGVFMCRHHGFNHACHYNYRCEHQIAVHRGNAL